MPLETKDLDPVLTGITEIKAKQETNATAVAEVKTEIEGVKTEVDGIKTETAEVKSTVAVLKDAADKNQEWIDKQIAEGNNVSLRGKKEVKSFNEIIGEALEANKEAIQNSSPGQYSKSNPLRINLMPELKPEGKNPVEVKTVGDMSITANFPSSTNWTTDVRDQLIPKPYERTWLADLLPQGTGTGLSILYPKENGGEGGAALWTDPTADKPQMDFDFTTQQAYFKWIAGYVIVDRDMMDNFSWMVSYIQQKMLVSLKIAENAFVLDGSADTNPVEGFFDVATAYNGTYATNVEKIIDAAFGQIVEDTFNYYVGNIAIMGPRASVGITLNKSGGSEEFDLPSGTSPFRSNSLALNSLQIVPIVNATLGNSEAIILDRNATSFIRRIQPEIRMFEDAALAKKNKVMFRVEEKATLVIFNNAAIVTTDLSAS